LAANDAFGVATMIVRAATASDLEPMRDIYAHHVLGGLGTFEETPPEATDFAQRIEAVRALGLPWLVAEVQGRVFGYGYASTFRPRSGYRYTAEDTVYVAPDRVGQGVGRALLDEIVSRCSALGLRQITAAIGDSGNAASIGLHRACGYEIAGVLRSVGFKRGRWVDVVLMQRALNDGDATAPEGKGWTVD
jgi:L-amino acid N-acyltransferase YncA